MKDEVNNVESMNGDKIKDDHQKDTSPKPKALNQYSPSNLFLNHSSMYSIISTAEHEKSLQEKKSKYNEHCVAAVIALVGQLATLASWSELNTFGRAANVVILAFFAVCLIACTALSVQTKKIMRKSENSNAAIFDQVSQQVIEKTSFTAVIVIATQRKNEPLKFLCDKSNFYLAHCRITPEKTITT